MSNSFYTKYNKKGDDIVDSVENIRRIKIYDTNLYSIIRNIEEYQIKESDINDHCLNCHMNPTLKKITEKQVRSFFNKDLETKDIAKMANDAKNNYSKSLAFQYVNSFSIKPPKKPIGRIDYNVQYPIGITYISSSNKQLLGWVECNCIRVSFGFEKDEIFFMNAFPIPYIKFNELSESEVMGLYLENYTNKEEEKKVV